jgi:phage RecT family recombinase
MATEKKNSGTTEQAQQQQQQTNTMQRWEPLGPKGFLKREEAMLSQFVTQNAGREYRPFELSALMLISDTPAIQECLRSREGEASLRNALMRAASTGLSLNPAEGKATIIAYNGRARYQVMKAGMIEEAIRSGSVAFLTCDLVRDKDEFEVVKSLDGDRYIHKPNTRERGNLIGVYAAAKLKDGATHVRYMTVAEVNEHRDRYRTNKRDDSMWATSFEGAALKTVLKSLLRNLHLAPTARALIIDDDRDEAGEWDATPIHVSGSSAAEVSEAIGCRVATEAAQDDGVVPPPKAGELL